MLQVFAKNSSGWDNLRGSMYVPETSKFDPTLIPVWLIAVSCITLGTLLSGHQAMGGPQRIDRQQGDNESGSQETRDQRPLPDLVRQRSNSSPPVLVTSNTNQVEKSLADYVLGNSGSFKDRERSSPTE